MEVLIVKGKAIFRHGISPGSEICQITPHRGRQTLARIDLITRALKLGSVESPAGNGGPVLATEGLGGRQRSTRR